jgi:hypothetical protein
MNFFPQPKIKLKREKHSLKENLRYFLTLIQKKNFWTESEDEILKQGVRKYGSTKWTKISKLLKSRPPKRCR